MKAQIFLILFFILPSTLLSDSWSDPSWEAMIKDSEVIALIEYASNGDFQAKAKIKKIYKGEVPFEEIWISGFSNRYGPIDKVRSREKFVVFLCHDTFSESDKEHLEDRINENPRLKDFYTAWSEGKVYDVSTPTSGDLKVRGNKVQYDLLSSTYYASQNFYPLEQFEEFLGATTGKNRNNFYKWAQSQLSVNILNSNSAQNIMMLYLSDFKEYISLYEKIIQVGLPQSNFALAKLLGKMEGEKSRDLLLELLEHENSLVQGEAVRQLSTQPTEFIGPILLSQLKSAGKEGLYSANLMDPVINHIDGGQIEIIKTLGDLKYKPAAEDLIPLLETEDDYVFNLIIKVLIQLESKGYIPYLNKHLEKRTKSHIFKICRIITDNDLAECKPALMEFISNHDRNIHPGYVYSISHSMGLGSFEDDETKEFLINDFSEFLNSKDTIESWKIKEWLKEYIEVFTDLKMKEAQDLIYESLFYWYGYDENFAHHSEIYKAKSAKEDSVRKRAIEVLGGDIVNEIKVIVFIENPEDILKGLKPQFDYIILINTKKETNDKRERTTTGKELFSMLRSIQQTISDSLGVSKTKISVRNGSYVQNLDQRFDEDITHSPMGSFYSYVKEIPNQKALIFLQAIKDNGIAKDDFDKRQLDKVIEELEIKLNE